MYLSYLSHVSYPWHTKKGVCIEIIMRARIDIRGRIPDERGRTRNDGGMYLSYFARFYIFTRTYHFYSFTIYLREPYESSSLPHSVSYCKSNRFALCYLMTSYCSSLLFPLTRQFLHQQRTRPCDLSICLPQSQ